MIFATAAFVLGCGICGGASSAESKLNRPFCLRRRPELLEVFNSYYSEIN
jgi:hypothetical protein